MSTLHGRRYAEGDINPQSSPVKHKPPPWQMCRSRSLKPWATASPWKLYVVEFLTENKLWWQPCLTPHKTYDSFNSMSITGVLLLRTWLLFSSWSRSLEMSALSNSCCRLSLHLPFIIMHYNLCALPFLSSLPFFAADGTHYFFFLRQD